MISYNFIPVTSTQIAGVSYDPNDDTLCVKFLNGSIYCYHDVPEVVYNIMLTSSSVGKYFSSVIKGKYQSEKI